jgi:hypothetical protein
MTGGPRVWSAGRLRRRAAPALAALGVVFAAPQALAWGATGHRMIGVLGAEALPATVPAFLHTPEAIGQIGEIAREPDRGKGTGDPHDSDLNPAHFIDLDDQGRIKAGAPVTDLPPTRAGYEAALQGAGSDSYAQGYLPYSMMEGWQQLVKDLAYWRVDSWAEIHEDTLAKRDWFARDRRLREALTLRDLGYWAHFVGDASQPMHVSVHFNGWGNFPNPKGYTNERVHAPFEGAFIHDHMTLDLVRARLAPYRACDCTIQQHVGRYLMATVATVEPFYDLEKAGGFKGGDARGQAFAAERLAAGASMLRDLVVDAWASSATMTVGYPAILPADVEAGKVDPYGPLVGED